MLKFTDYDIVFQEIPGEVTLAINLSLCPNSCVGCHSPQLRENIGQILNESTIDELLHRYGNAITCVSLMGGDNDTSEVTKMANIIKVKGYKSAWYSGRQELPIDFLAECFDYVKVGPYIAEMGGLDCPTTNQRLYMISAGKMTDITYRMQKKNI